MEYYFNNKATSCGCGCGSSTTSSQQYGYEIECEFNKYTEVSKYKCEEASEISEEACQIAILAKAKEAEVVNFQNCASAAACEALALWERYNKLTSESTKLLKEAQKALEESTKTQKRYDNSYSYLKKVCGCGGCGCNCCC
ncbi:MAG: hypothetical protein R3Y64_00240 [Peptostreptococcaceae bacterium]